MNEKKRGGGFFASMLKYKLIFYLVLIFALVMLVLFGFQNVINIESKTTKLGFENIGELATQTAYCTEVSTLDASRELFGHDIPFTRSHYIYSYDVEVKAGYNFEEIEWEVNDTVITVKLPPVKVLSTALNTDSFKLYLESESIFRPISLDEINQSIGTLEENAKNNAIANGLFDNARTNAETMLSAFFASVYDPAVYTINYIDSN